MNHRSVMSLAALPLLLVTSTASAQTGTPQPETATQPASAPTDAPTPSPPPAAPTPPIAPAALPKPSDPPMTGKWKTSIYGFAEFDAMYDTTQSFGESTQNNTIVAPGTFRGDNGRTTFTAKNSRIGFKLSAPEFNGLKASAQSEMDFFGPVPAGINEATAQQQGYFRMRHYFLKLETPIVDILAGQFHDLFAWGGGGFYPRSVAFLGVVGEVYHRQPQLKISKVIKTDAINIEVAGAAVRPFQRDSQIPDLEAGIRLQLNGWKGARGQGSGSPEIAAAAIGVSGMYRKVKVTPNLMGGSNTSEATGNGVAVNLFLPVVPASGDDLSNAITLTGEVSIGEGIADMYNGLNGGASFPANIPGSMPAAAYTANMDSGVFMFDRANNLKGVKWMGAVAGLQYYLPVGTGRTLFVSGLFGYVKSDNLLDLAPAGNQSGLWNEKMYFDGCLFWALTPAVQLAFSYQQTKQTNGPAADGTILKPVNHRGEMAWYYFF